MILNMPVNNGTNANGNNNNNNNTDTSSLSQGQTEYTNFLKRKYTDHEMDSTVISSQCSANYEDLNNHTNTNWKKRHIDHTVVDAVVSNYGAANQLNDSQDTTEEGSCSFNIIANSTFINDLFAYDANLIVPVTVNSLSDSLLTDSVTFSTPSTVSANAKNDFEDNNEHWQASDLLELDHRYNSSLQTEISQLNPTIDLKTSEDHNSIINQTQPSPQDTTNHQFVLPQKPIGSSIKRLNTLNCSNPVAVPATSCSSSSSSPSGSLYNNDHMEQDCDFEDKNLSWLLNFKFDEFPHLNPDVMGLNGSKTQTKTQTNTFYNNSQMNSNTGSYSTGLSSSSSAAQCKMSFTNSASATGNDCTATECSKTPKAANKTGKKFEELVMEVTSELEGNDMVVAESIVIEETPLRAPKKPPFTYTELIEYALEDKGELTVSGIYQWISDRFPYYKSNDDRWKNSVRHNLSINPHFRKGHKAPQGAGHLWTISSGDSAENVLAWEHKKQRLDLFFKMESMNRERLQQHQQKQQEEKLRKQNACQQETCNYDEAAIAAAALQQEMLQQNHNNNDGSMQNQNSLHSMETTNEQNLHENSLTYNDLLTDEELRKTAGQILNGIHREVEVQAVNQTIIGTYQDVLLDNDYLNPIHKDVVVNESGLRHSSVAGISTHCHSHHHSSSTTGPYYVTEIDPLELGIQMTTSQHQHNQSATSSASQQHQHPNHNQQHVGVESDVVLFNDEFNLNYFAAYNPHNDIVA